MRGVYLLVCVAFLGACEEAEKKKELPRQKSFSLDQTIKALSIPEEKVEEKEAVQKPPQEDLPPKKKEVQIDFSFPGGEAFTREEKVREGRALLRRETFKKVIQEEQQAERIEKNLDDTYQVYAPHEPADISTLPVDRTRILTPDSIIPAILQTSVNSTFAGRAIAIIPKAVFSMEGDTIVIPAHSKVICKSFPTDAIGQTRISLQCTRILTPKGVSIHLTQTEMADQMGQMGLTGNVDTRFKEKYGLAFWLTGIGATTKILSESLTPKKESQSPWSLPSNTGDTLSKNLGSIAKDSLEKSIDLRPVITIPAGTRIQIVPSRDIYLRKKDKSYVFESLSEGDKK